MSSSFREGWVVVNDVPSHVLTWGGWVEDTLPDGDSVIVCIPGNPGLTSYYHNFLDTLHQQLAVPVWIVCHAGHERPPSSMNLKFPRDPQLYDVAGQVAHKVAFLKQYLPANKKLYLIGHSVGTKMILEILKDEQIAKHTEKCYLMMPTIERIAETPNGKYTSFMLKYFMSALLLVSWIFSFFPPKCRRFLISYWFTINGLNNVDEKCMDATCHLTLPKVVRKSLSLVLDEFAVIKELDMQVLNTHCPKFRVFFARKDGWSPLSFMESLKKAKPDINVSVLGEQFIHAFVLENPHEMAELLTDEIKQHQAKS